MPRRGENQPGQVGPPAKNVKKENPGPNPKNSTPKKVEPMETDKKNSGSGFNGGKGLEIERPQNGK